jgi:beta-RFAP synthase
LVGRGKRSALGIHGFAQGGFLVDAGKRHPDRVAPLVARVAFPETWRIVLVLPPDEYGLYGLEENQAFQRLNNSGTALALTESLCRLVLLNLLPALHEQDLETFGEALYDFNLRVGEVFAPVQGGPYASARLTEMVAYIRQQGIRGTGQSSWGPALFAVVADEDRAHDLVRRLHQRFALTAAHVTITVANNHGAEIVQL